MTQHHTSPALALLLTLLGGAAFAGLAPAAQAQTATAPDARPYAIPAGPLGAALLRFSSESGIFFAGDTEQAKGKTSPGLQGRYGVADGLAALLAGTGLEAFRKGDGSYGLRAKAAVAAPDAVPRATAASLAEVKVTGSALRDGTTEATGSFTTRSVSSATHLPLTLRETPQSVTVLTSARIDADNLVDVVDIAKATPGLQLSTNDARPSLMSRGYAVDSMTQDGIKSEYIGDEDTLGNLAMQDRVEVVRGATGLVQGGGNPSAAVNMIRKRPTDIWQAKGFASAGSWDDYRLMADVSGPLTEDGRIRGRVVGYVQNAGDYYDLAFNDKRLGYVTFDIDLTERTSLNIGYSHVYSNRNRSWGGLPASYEGSHLDLPRSTFGGTDWEYDKNKADTLYVSLAHDFGGGWALDFNGTRVKRSYDMLATWLVNTPDVGGYGHVWYAGKTPRRQSAADLKLSGPVSWFGRQHDLLFGATVNRQSRRTDEWMEGWGAPITSGVDLTTWNHTAPRPDTSLASPWYDQSPTARNKQDSLYSAGRFNVADALDLVLGARLDWYDKEDPWGGDPYKLNAHLTKYAGLTWKFSDRHSAYISYSDIFQPQNVRNLGGNVLAPISGRNYEIGMKGEYMGGALNGSIALFRMDESNRPVYLADQSACTIAPDACFSAGTARTEGVDIELQGAITPDWQVGAGLTWSESRLRKDADPANIGRRLDTTAPTTLFKLSTQYTLPGALNRLTLGGRINWQSKMYWDMENTYGDVARNQQPARAIVDLSARYRLTKNVHLKLDVNNVFDKVYYSSIGYGDAWGSSEVYGRPRSALLTLNASY